MMFQILKLSENTLVALTIHRKIEGFDEKDLKLNDDQVVQVVACRN